MKVSAIDKLTAPQLEMAAADLRNARLVVKHAGHFQYALVDRASGAVCALSAIQLATCYRRLAYFARTYISLVTDGTLDELDARAYRLQNAVLAFADMIPDELCERCPSFTERDSRVVHYNDSHCVSGDLLQNMLGLAADKAMDRAAEKRSLVGGRLLASV